jgi:YidC/Oxa1 family membrane protein insertase
MERRLLLVFALTFLVILASQPLLKKYLPQAPPPAKQSTNPSPAPAAPSMSAEPAVPVPPVGNAKQASTEADTVVENHLYRIVFTNRGGQVKSWILKKFKATTESNSPPLELVNPAAGKFGNPLSIWIYDEPLRNRVNSALYVGSETGTLSAPATLTFDYSDQDLSVKKSFTFDHSYVVRVEVSVQYHENWVTALPMWPSGFGDETTLPAYAAAKVEYQSGESVERLAAKKVVGGATVQGPINWGAVTDQYFAAAFLPQEPPAAALVSVHNAIEIPKDPRNPQETTKADVLGVAVGALYGPTRERVFVGPKAMNVLDSIAVEGLPAGTDANLRQLVDYGWLGVISRPLFVWLRWTYEHIVANWGWAIVVQTLIITLALLPLRISQMRSALKMQRVAPQIKSIQEKYKKYSMRDPRKQEMNTEIAALYKKEGVNPIGGCLPLLIQMPFLFAYYRMLNVALDLRHAHWLWISDLSSRDPYFILPTLLVLSMFLMQRMTPQAGMDPAQQKMMNWMMPLMMGFIFFNLASGLNLYYAESNLIMIGQQSIMNRTSLGREMREMMLKRAKKKEKD